MMIILRNLIIIYLISFGYCHAAEHTSAEPPPKNILVLGDSLSAAYGIELELGWVNLLQQRLQEKTNQYDIINASVSGETTAGGLARLPNLLSVYQPVLCIIELGANDGLRGQSTSIMQSNLDQILQLCSKTGTSLLLGIKLPPNYGEQYTRAFENVYFELADKYDVPLVPFLLDGIALEESYMQSDGLHPNGEAQPLLLENVWPEISKLLKITP